MILLVHRLGCCYLRNLKLVYKKTLLIYLNNCGRITTSNTAEGTLQYKWVACGSAYHPALFFVMKPKFAILLDAGFVKKHLGSQSNPVTAQRIVNFTDHIINREELQNYRLHRIYYYDAEPLEKKKLKPLTGGRVKGIKLDFSSTSLFHANTQLLNELRKMPFFAVRLGDVVFRGWNVKKQILDPSNTVTSKTITSADIIPNIQQKGVDMRIGLDIASLALKNQVDIIVLVTCDSDFIPALKFARREGKQIFLFSLAQSLKQEIFGHVDLCIEDAADFIMCDSGN